jgi:outer membrane protein OmpA-like peptidoglycan-associated protein
MRNGAFVRRWTTAGVQYGPQNVLQEGGLGIVPKFAQPVELVVEMPAVARLERIGVMLRTVKAASVDVAVASDPKAFRAVGTVRYAGADTDKELMLDTAADARWVRFTVHHEKGSELRIQRIAAYGTPGPPQRGKLAGMWSGADSMTSSPDELFTGAKGRVPDALPPKSGSEPRITAESDGVLTAFQCSYRNDAWHGQVTDNVARLGGERLQLAGNGNMLVGYANDRYIVALRAKSLAACATSVSGKGPSVLALMRVPSETAPEIDPAFVPGYRFERRMIVSLNAAALQHAAFAVLVGDCAATKDLTPRQQSTLLQWVADGHKLIIRDADVCSASDYSFLPYGFSTKAAGAHGARGAILSIGDPSTLGSGPNDPAHMLDVEAYLKHEFQQVGDGDIVQTKDPRWCGHLFSANAVGANGWVHAYARYGRGLIIYDGLDRDDLAARVPAALRVVQLEYAQPVQAELPCNARVASLFVLVPSVTKQLPAGRQTTLQVPMRLAYAAMTTMPIDIALSIAGDAPYPARVSPTRVRLASGSGTNVLASIQFPAGWSGSHAYTVTAAGGIGQSAQATIRIDGSVALARAFESQRRVRIYGIHFDVDSARIQSLSEATIAQIADVLAVHRDWKMRVEGHTDSDGGAAYNRKLSVRRAEAVVADLVTHYHVARARLSSAGMGLTHPVASNATEAGKALNRRVELVRL